MTKGFDARTIGLDRRIATTGATWSTWLDEDHAVHVVTNVDVHPMMLGSEPSPWHAFGDVPCPCQPKVLERDPVSGQRIVGHKDPIH